MCEHACLFFMSSQIEFYEVPEQAFLCCEIRKPEHNSRTPHRFRCEVDYGNVILAVYDENDEIIATSVDDLKEIGAVNIYLEAHHTVEVV